MRIAIVGLGTIAQTHLAAWERLADVELVAGVEVRDVEPWSFRRHCVPIHRRVEELVAYQPGYVVVATPTAVHFHTCEQIWRSLHTRILVEKPLASTLRDSLALLERPDDLVVLYHAAYAPEVRWAAERLGRWLDQFGPITSLDCLFADPWGHDPTTAAERYVSSWVDSGINCLSVLARLVTLEDVDLTVLDEQASVYEASVQFTSLDRGGHGRIRTSWEVPAAEKHTRIAFEAGAEVVLKHQEVSGAVKDARGATIAQFQFDHSMPRLVSHYVNLYQSVLFGAEPYPFRVEENTRLSRLLLGALEP